MNKEYVEVKSVETDNTPEYTLDVDNLPSIEHKWVDRGLKLSCENAGHPHHSHFKIGAVKIT